VLEDPLCCVDPVGLDGLGVLLHEREELVD